MLRSLRNGMSDATARGTARITRDGESFNTHSLVITSTKSFAETLDFKGRFQSMRKPETLKKAAMLEHWRGLTADQAVTPAAVVYKHAGSTYDEDGIRITGSREFIDSVLSRLKGLLEFENGETRLQVVYKESVDRVSQLPMGSFNCYVQVHTRGDEARMVNRMVSGIAGREVIASRGY
jgi:hypothetical protein